MIDGDKDVAVCVEANIGQRFTEIGQGCSVGRQHLAATHGAFNLCQVRESIVKSRQRLGFNEIPTARDLASLRVRVDDLHKVAGNLCGSAADETQLLPIVCPGSQDRIASHGKFHVATSWKREAWVVKNFTSSQCGGSRHTTTLQPLCAAIVGLRCIDGSTGFRLSLELSVDRVRKETIERLLTGQVRPSRLRTSS